jgi:uncharacterized protein
VNGREVRVVYTKYDGSLHWHLTMQHLGEDEHGIWLGAAAGTSTRRGSEPPVVMQQPFVALFPDGQWWTGTFNGEPARTEIYCDIGTPPRWLNPGEVTMADLDLDVLRVRATGQVMLVDEDEFAEHQISYGYPAEVIGKAQEAAAFLQHAIADGAEPFASRYLAWLDQVR